MSSNVSILAPNLIVESGSVINAEGNGYPSRTGPGAGGYAGVWGTNTGGGGGYGGAGGRGFVGSYGDGKNSVNMGSGGGEGVGCVKGRGCVFAQGGVGGGAVKIEVSGLFVLHGLVTANGSEGEYRTITDENGETYHVAGGGGGGRISLDIGEACTREGSLSLISVVGGTGYNAGKSGTAVCKKAEQ